MQQFDSDLETCTEVWGSDLLKTIRLAEAGFAPRMSKDDWTRLERGIRVMND